MTDKRISALRKKLSESSLSAILITSYENYRYFSGFSGSNCVLIITEDKNFALTDGRYDVQIRQQTHGFEITVISRPMREHIAEILSENNISSIGYEAQNISDFELSSLRMTTGDSVSFVSCPDFGEELRAVKDDAEILAMKKAAEIADDAFSALVKKLSFGMTEIEAASLLEYEMACRKSRTPAFSTVAASAERGSMPHAEAEDIVIPKNCLMTFDFGAMYDGYKSDITRTIHIGNPGKELSELWELVYEVQRACVGKVRPGISCRELDLFARELFEKRGMEKYFSHSLGHGVGLAVHEAPTVSRRSDTILQKNMIITIEPGLYIEGLGGVRIEDSVLVTDDGFEEITHSPHRINIEL